MRKYFFYLFVLLLLTGCSSFFDVSPVETSAKHADCVFFTRNHKVIGVEKSSLEVKVFYRFADCPETPSVLPDGRLWVPIQWNSTGTTVLNKLVIIKDGTNIESRSIDVGMGPSLCIGSHVFQSANALLPPDGKSRLSIFDADTLQLKKELHIPSLSGFDRVVVDESYYYIFSTGSFVDPEVGSIIVLDRKTLDEKKEIKNGDIAGLTMPADMDGDIKGNCLLVTGGRDHTLQCYNFETKQLLKVNLDSDYGMQPFQNPDHNQKFLYTLHSDSPYFLVYEKSDAAGDPNRIWFFDPATMKLVKTVSYDHDHSGIPVWVADSKVWISGSSWDDPARVFDLETGTLLKEIAFPE